MANTNKTKAEILQELESIKGLLLEEDDIPILQEMEGEDEILNEEFDPNHPCLTICMSLFCRDKARCLMNPNPL